MAQTNENKCSQCGSAFDSVEALQEHEKNCNKKTKLAPGTSGVTAEPATKSDKEGTDMLIEDRFQATDH